MKLLFSSCVFVTLHWYYHTVVPFCGAQNIRTSDDEEDSRSRRYFQTSSNEKERRTHITSNHETRRLLVPTEKKSSTASHSSPFSCSNNPNKFVVPRTKGNTKRTCDWVARKASWRCDTHPEAVEHCPITCNTCPLCADDTSERFIVTQAGQPDTKKSCGWVANKATYQRCRFQGVADLCPRTCGLCNPISLSNLLDDTTFNPVGANFCVKLIDIAGEFEPNPTQVTFTVTTESAGTINASSISYADGQLCSDIRTTEGWSYVVVKAVTKAGKHVEFATNVWAGAETVDAYIMNKDETPYTGSATITAILGDNNHIYNVESVPIGGVASFENIPKRTILFRVMGEDATGMYAIGVESSSSINITVSGFDESSPIYNNDFSKGLDGWNIEMNPANVKVVDHDENAGPNFQSSEATGSHGSRRTQFGIENLDLEINTDAVGPVYIERTFDIPPDATGVSVRYRFKTEEVPGGYCDTQFNDAFSIEAFRVVKSTSNGTPSYENIGNAAPMTMNSIGCNHFDQVGSTGWKHMYAPLSTLLPTPASITVNLKMSVTNVLDGLYDSRLIIDYVCDSYPDSVCRETWPQKGPNPCKGKKVVTPYESRNCYDVNGSVGGTVPPQSGANVTKGYEGKYSATDTETPMKDSFFAKGLCPVNVHWHLGTEHTSVGEYDEEHGKGPTCVGHRRKLAGKTRKGGQCSLYDESNNIFTDHYDWEHCVDMEVGQTYEVHWPHSIFGKCGTPYQYQEPFYDGVFCTFPNAIGKNVTDLSLPEKIGVQAQVFVVVNDETYYRPNLFHGMVMDDTYGTDIAYYTGSTTGTSSNNTICSGYGPITWQVDRKCNMISASSFDKMCADMKSVRDPMDKDLHPHGSRIVVNDDLASKQQV